MITRKCEVEVNNISSLDVEPSVSSEAFMRLFDKTGSDMKNYINNSLINEINADEEANSRHRLNNDIHVTAQEKEKWNEGTGAKIASGTSSPETAGLDPQVIYYIQYEE